MWALRYPDSHELYLLDRRYDSQSTPPDRDFHMRTKRIRAWSKHLCTRSSVVFASEPMDDDPRWCLLEPGELVHVDAGLHITRSLVLPDPPRHLASSGGPEHARRAGAARVGLNPAAPVASLRLAEWVDVTTRRALVLAGGGIAGIAWETGILRGIADESPAAARLLLDSDVLVGTSAGSAVAAQISSGSTLEELYDRQVAESSAEIDSGVDVEAITEMFLAALGEPYETSLDKTRQQMQRIGAVALATTTVPEPVRRQVIAQRLPSHDWPDRVLRLTAIDVATGELVVFDSGVGCRACRCGGGQLRGARRVATGDNRGPTLYGRRGRQLGQPRCGR